MNMELREDQSQQKVVMRSSYGSGTRSTKRGTECSSSEKEKKLKLTFKDQKMHHLIFQEGGLADGTEVTYFSGGRKLREGSKQGRGIRCSCCKVEMSPSQFEAHAGMPSRKKPYDHIFLSNGISLHEYLIALKLNCENLTKKNDALCRVCKKGGDLLPCEGCPRSFHKECITDEPIIHREKWFCEYCIRSMKCVGPNACAKRRSRVTNNLDNRDIVACVLCRACDFSEDGFNDRTVIVCEQCEKEYHIGCLREIKQIILKKLPRGNWFCTLDCGSLHDVLNILDTNEPEPVHESLMDLITVDRITNNDVKWIIRRGKDASEENRLLLTQAVEIFHDGFNPIIDSVTGNDFVASMAYGLKMGASDFSGVHCAMLIINSKVITAGMFRVFGHEIAELPIVATCQHKQRNGYFRLFISCFEQLLSYLKVKKLVVPAAKDNTKMWTDKFGLKKVTSAQLQEYQQKHTSMVAFHDTCLLEKEVPESRTTFKNDKIFRERSDARKRQRFFELEEEKDNLRERVSSLESELVLVKNELETTKLKLEKSEFEKLDLQNEVQVLQMLLN